jgi:hypothetical protein
LFSVINVYFSATFVILIQIEGLRGCSDRTKDDVGANRICSIGYRFRSLRRAANRYGELALRWVTLPQTPRYPWAHDTANESGFATIRHHHASADLLASAKKPRVDSTDGNKVNKLIQGLRFADGVAEKAA